MAYSSIDPNLRQVASNLHTLLRRVFEAFAPQGVACCGEDLGPQAWMS